MPFSPLDEKKTHGSVKKPTTILLKFRKPQLFCFMVIRGYWVSFLL